MLPRPEGIQSSVSLPSGNSPYQRSVSQSSMASSCLWSPVISSVSIAVSTNQTYSLSAIPLPDVRHKCHSPPHPSEDSISHPYTITASLPRTIRYAMGQHLADNLSDATCAVTDHSPPQSTTPSGTRLLGPHPPTYPCPCCCSGHIN
jgi:hypothetical protein